MRSTSLTYSLVALPQLKGVEHQFCQNEPNLRWRFGEKSVPQYGVISAVDGVSELMATIVQFSFSESSESHPRDLRAGSGKTGCV
jgi:hypothetical protein